MTWVAGVWLKTGGDGARQGAKKSEISAQIWRNRCFFLEENQSGSIRDVVGHQFCNKRGFYNIWQACYNQIITIASLGSQRAEATSTANASGHPLLVSSCWLASIEHEAMNYHFNNCYIYIYIQKKQPMNKKHVFFWFTKKKCESTSN